jgi:hypothetical protein
MFADLDAFVRHDHHAVDEREVADLAGAVFAERKRNAGT